MSLPIPYVFCEQLNVVIKYVSRNIPIWRMAAVEGWQGEVPTAIPTSRKRGVLGEGGGGDASPWFTGFIDCTVSQMVISSDV